jgi:uncharacterized membrane protein
VALAMGALMLGAGLLLFVSAHWDSLSPQARFVLVLVLVAGFHLGGAAAAERSPGTSMTLHAVGTVTLGAGIYLAGVLVLIKLRPLGGEISLYAWWAVGAMALVAWGVREARAERINMGSAIFAATVLTFYFSEVMDQLGRSASLIGLGLLFLMGGWTLEHLRRRLILQIQGGRA